MADFQGNASGSDRQNTAQARYLQLSRWRDPYLRRARQAACLTLPYAMPPDGWTTDSELREPYQGLGARAVTNLTGRITNRLMPAAVSFFRLQPPGELSIEGAVEEGKETTSDLEQQLAVLEQALMRNVNALNWRDATLTSVEQLIIAGNVLEFILPDNNIRLYRLDQFVVRKNRAGQIVELIIEEFLQEEEIPEDQRAKVKANASQTQGSIDQPRNMAEEAVAIYTWIRFQTDGTYKRTQWVGDQELGEAGTFTIEDLPYRHLGWKFIPGEDYGHGKVEDHMGDFRTLETHAKALIELSTMASKHYIFVRPGTTAKGVVKRIMTAPNGQAVVADPQSVELKTFESVAGTQVTAAEVDRITQNLSRAFLLQSGAQRQAERVTAEEIRRDIEEIEAAIGPIFSKLANQQMEWRLEILMRQLDERLVPIAREVDITILTGLEALSREAATEKALRVAPLLQIFGEEARLMLNIHEFLSPAMVGAGFPRAVKSNQEYEAALQQEALRKAAAAGVESAASSIGQQAATPEG
ncbi:MAG: hypothetical protein GY906_23315 [bacterium]|nr:hypothetical protein [bacterium]